MKKMNVTKLTSGLTLLAAGLLVLSLTACGNKTDDAVQTTDSDTAVETTTDNTSDTTSEETTTDNTSDTASEETTTDNTSGTASEETTTDNTSDTASEETTEDQGASITIEVVDADGNTTSYTGTTDDEFLFGAIDDIDGVTIDGYESDWGYYITTVNDMAADYDADGAYWSIYVNGEYGSYGVETQPITDGDVYTFKYEVYQAAN